MNNRESLSGIEGSVEPRVPSIASNASSTAEGDSPSMSKLHQHIKAAGTKARDLSTSAAKHAGAKVSAAATVTATAVVGAARRVTGGLDQLESEIANHYLDGLKYGLAGSNGTCCSNYYRYTKNNHPCISLFCADPRNPYNKHRRWLCLWCALCLSFLLTAVQQAYTFDSEAATFAQESVASLVIALVVNMMDSIAKCSVCYRQNCCVSASKRFGLCLLYMLAVLSCLYVIGGIVIIAENNISAKKFIYVFALSFILEQLAPFYLEIWNWILVSWEGCLCCPIFPSCCCGCCSICPRRRWYPLLGTCPVKFLLSLYGMGESTYVEDREEFKKKYPDRLAIDVYDEKNSPVHGCALPPSFDTESNAMQRC